MKFCFERIVMSVILMTMVVGILSTSAAAGQSATGSLVGTWKLDIDASVKEATGADAEKLNQIKAIGFSITLEFKKDDKMEMNMDVGGMKRTKASSWKMIKDDKKELLIETTDSDSGKTSKLVVTFLKGDAVLIKPTKDSPDKSPALVLNRVKEEEKEKK